jgi:hypothetical protein
MLMFRNFEAADPFGETWQARFIFQQNAISIRHADAVDVKFVISSGDNRQEKVIALAHPDLLWLSGKTGHPITDPWVCRLAAQHLKHMLETWEDMEKTVVTPSRDDLERYHAALEEEARATR